VKNVRWFFHNLWMDFFVIPSFLVSNPNKGKVNYE
jgi:hypothetical protein